MNEFEPLRIGTSTSTFIIGAAELAILPALGITVLAFFGLVLIGYRPGFFLSVSFGMFLSIPAFLAYTGWTFARVIEHEKLFIRVQFPFGRMEEIMLPDLVEVRRQRLIPYVAMMTFFQANGRRFSMFVDASDHPHLEDSLRKSGVIVV